MKYYAIFLAALVASTGAFAQQQYFFYSYGERMLLNCCSNHILLKFSREIPASRQESIVHEAIGSLMKKKNIMTETYRNGSYKINQIIELKDYGDLNVVE